MEHHFNIEVAKEYGVIEAVLINHFQFWIAKNKANGSNFHDGRYWTFNSQKAMLELFPYLSQKSIRTVLQHLTDSGVIIVGNYNDNLYNRTNWYAFADEDKWLCQKGQIHMPETANGAADNGKCKTDNIPYNNTDNIPPYNNITLSRNKDNIISPQGESLISDDEKLFERAWILYGKKGNKQAAHRYWVKLNQSDKKAILAKIPQYVASTPDITFRKDFSGWINPTYRRWENETLTKLKEERSHVV